MALYDKNNIFAVLQDKVSAKGFNLDPDKSKMAKNTPTTKDLLEAIAETLSEILSQDQSKEAVLEGSSFKIGPSGLQNPVSYKGATIKADMSTDPAFFTWFETLTGLLQAVYPEPGLGSPSVFATALKVLIGLKPTSLTGKITDGSGSVKVTI